MTKYKHYIFKPTNLLAYFSGTVRTAKTRVKILPIVQKFCDEKLYWFGGVDGAELPIPSHVQPEANACLKRKA